MVWVTLWSRLERPAYTLLPVQEGLQTLHCWVTNGLWERVFQALTQDQDNEYLVIDSSIVQVHAVDDRKRGTRTRLWGAPEKA